VKLVYSDRYAVDIGDHPWMTGKYAETVRLLKDRVASSSFSVIESPMADDQDILRAHTFTYWQKLCDIDFSEEEERLLELPVTSEVIDLFWRMAGGTVLATEIALVEGISVHVGGGFHHAFPGLGFGFCLINDIAVSVKSVLDRGMIRRAAIIDCDLHQGDGTAWIFKDDPSVVTFSVHQRQNFPHYKQQGTVDLHLENGTEDRQYLAILSDGLAEIAANHGPFDLIHYQAGADPYKGDTLGDLALTVKGLQARDRMVMEWAVGMGTPIVITLGGGYPESITEVAQIHLNTILTALETAGRS
jgi:acetoin utilization deacetylase AcuC-like enzyme